MKRQTIRIGPILGIPIGLDYSWFLIFGLLIWTGLKQMDRDGVSRLLVMKDGQLLGMLSREGVINFLRTLQELAAYANDVGSDAPFLDTTSW